MNLATIACENSKQETDYHFIGVSKKVNLGSGAESKLIKKELYQS